MLTNRTFSIVWVSSGHGVDVPNTIIADQLVNYSGDEVQVSGGN
jgi:hypothetical protein